MSLLLKSLQASTNNFPSYRIEGKISRVRGLLLECEGISSHLYIGSRCMVETLIGKSLLCEVVGFDKKAALMMAFGDIQGVGIGSRVSIISSDPTIRPDESWLGRVINSLANPIDDKGLMLDGNIAYNINAQPPQANKRKRVGGKFDLGVRSLNQFVTCCEGQRLGIFSGSGVGKSILLSMLAKYSQADVNVIALVGERGREVQEFIEDDLGEEGLAKSILIVSTSDEPALMRRQAAYLAMTIAEYFRDAGKHVLLLMDSVTRFAQAQREIGLSSGEPPTTRGYTPSVFSILPKLLERAGTGTDDGAITGIFSILVEGDDHNEPIADAARSILDGHIVLDRSIADRGRFPAVNILKSVSRMMPECNSPEEMLLINRAKELLSTYEDMAELIRLGAYKAGSDAKVDEAIFYYPHFEKFFAQNMHEKSDFAAGYAELHRILSIPMTKKK